MIPVPAHSSSPLCTALLALVALLGADAANAWSLSIGAASRRVFLHVGNGTANANNGTINRVEVNLSGA